MDKTERKMTKIARELNKLTVQAMKEKGIGTAAPRRSTASTRCGTIPASHRRSCGKN